MRCVHASMSATTATPDAAYWKLTEVPKWLKHLGCELGREMIHKWHSNEPSTHCHSQTQIHPSQQNVHTPAWSCGAALPLSGNEFHFANECNFCLPLVTWMQSSAWQGKVQLRHSSRYSSSCSSSSSSREERRSMQTRWCRRPPRPHTWLQQHNRASAGCISDWTQTPS